MSRKIEQAIVDKVREILYFQCGYPLPSTKADKNNIIVYEQDSYKTNVELSNLLAHSSKCSSKTKDKLWSQEAEFGKPEFVIINTKENLAIVIECKVGISKCHISKKLREENILEFKQSTISKNAVEGALHYAKFLSKNYNVIAVGITGDVLPDESVSELFISTYIWEKGGIWKDGESGPFLNLNINSLLSYNEYLKQYSKLDIVKKNMLEVNSLTVAKNLNETLHTASVPPIERSLLVSGLLLVLRNPIFVNSYNDKTVTSEALLNLLGSSIDSVLQTLGVADEFKKEMLKAKFRDVFNQQGLLKNNARVLREVLSELEKNVLPCMTGDFGLDIIGKFYSEFLRYAKGDKNSGIVLTPSHITELFCDLVDLNIDDVVLDICLGTAGFLISAMNRLYSLADSQPNSEELKDNIKRNQLYGCEDDKLMFSLGCSNMILRGDGKANMYYGSCFDHKEDLQNKATIGMINPPYSGTDMSCLEFIDYLCSCIKYKDEKGNYVGKNRSKGDNLVCAIIPTSYMNSDTYKDERKKLLENNTLVAVMSMPIDLFRPVNTITCIVLLKAGVPHDKDIPTYLGNWKDDGYMWKKGIGRIPDGDKFESIKERWIKSFRRTIEDKEIGIWKCLDGEDECCWERYAEIDTSEINHMSFENQVKQFMLYKTFDSDYSNFDNSASLNIDKWKDIKIIDLFDRIEQCKCINSGELEDGEDIWYIGAKKKDNGLMRKVKIKENLITKGNGIIMIGSGEGSVGYANYIDKDFIGSTSLSIGYNSELDKYTGLFLATMMDRYKFKYNYGRGWSGNRLRESEILLPVVLDENGLPKIQEDGKYIIDWNFMRDYIKTLGYSKFI